MVMPAATAAGATQLFGKQIGAERDQQADQDLGASVFAQVSRHPLFGWGHGPDRADADRQAAE
jgi:hypothetical protein